MNFLQQNTKSKKDKENSRLNFMAADEANRNTMGLFAAPLNRHQLQQQRQQSTSNGSKSNASDINTSAATMATSSNNALSSSTMYVAITSGRGRAQTEIGLAFIDIESPSMNLCQMSDDSWYTGLLTKLNVLQPEKIIVPSTLYDASADTNEGKLLKYVREQFPYLNVVKIPRRHFPSEDGLHFVHKYCSEKHNDIKQLITHKYYALAAVSGLVKYLENMMNITFVDGTLKLDFETKYGHMMIDIDTSNKLELLAPAIKSSTKGNHASLYDLLDHCVTAIGKRSLRARILEPSCDLANILELQESISELKSTEFIELNIPLTVILKNFYSVDRLSKLSMVVIRDDDLRSAEALINKTIQLKKCLQNIPLLLDRLKPLTTKTFRDIYEGLQDSRYENMLEHIDTIMNKDLSGNRRDAAGQLYQRMYCVQEGVNNLLDISRQLYNDLTTELQEHALSLSTKCGQPFKMNYTAARGFHLQLMVSPTTTVNDFPDDLEVLELKRNTCFLTTSDITKLDIRLKSVIEEITVQSNVVIASMLAEITKELDAFYDLSGFIATLDILLSLAQVSAIDGFVRPRFGDEMRVVSAIHPLIERNIERTVAIANNIIATPDYNFFVITGPNMSGKTVYIKTAATLQIMAQLGCYVPAASAQFRITDRIFSRMGTTDSIEMKASLFVTEMRTMEYILKNITPNSLVIIDELCQSTNPQEGAELAWDLCEKMICLRGIANKGEYFISEEPNDDANGSLITRSSSLKDTKLEKITGPFVYLTTHYHSLVKLAKSYFNVVNLCFNAEETLTDGERHLKYNYIIQEGQTSIRSYGLALASTVRFPLDIVPRAEEIYVELKNSIDEREVTQAIHPQRFCSKFSKDLVTDPSEMSKLNESSTTITDGIDPLVLQKAKDRPKNFGNVFNKELLLSGTTTRTAMSSTTAAMCFKFDKVLYNLYSDIASAVRCNKLNQNCENDLPNDKRNEITKNLLEQFVFTQPKEFFQMIRNFGEKFPDFTKQAETSTFQDESLRKVENSRSFRDNQESLGRKECSKRHSLEIMVDTTSARDESVNLSQLSYHSLQRRFGGLGDLNIHAHSLHEINTSPFQCNAEENIQTNNDEYDVPMFNKKSRRTSRIDSRLWSSMTNIQGNVNAEGSFDFNREQSAIASPNRHENFPESDLGSDSELDNDADFGSPPQFINPTQFSVDEMDFNNIGNTQPTNLWSQTSNFSTPEQHVTSASTSTSTSNSSSAKRVSFNFSGRTPSLKSPSFIIPPQPPRSEFLAATSGNIYQKFDDDIFSVPEPPTLVPDEMTKKSLGPKRMVLPKPKIMADNRILNSSWLAEAQEREKYQKQIKRNELSKQTESEPIMSNKSDGSNNRGQREQRFTQQMSNLLNNVFGKSRLSDHQKSEPNNDKDEKQPTGGRKDVSKNNEKGLEKRSASSKDSGLAQTNSEQVFESGVNIPPVPTPQQQPNTGVEFDGDLNDIILPAPGDFV